MEMSMKGQKPTNSKKVLERKYALPGTKISLEGFKGRFRQAEESVNFTSTMGIIKAEERRNISENSSSGTDVGH